MTRHPELPERDRRILGVARPGLHRSGGAGLVAVAGQPRLRRVVGHAAQRHGPARRAGLRAPAAHLGRPRADRPRLSQLRRPAAGRAARRALRRPQVEARLRRAGTVERPAVARLAGGLARVASGRVRDRPGGRHDDVRAARLRAARRRQAARRPRRDRRPRLAQGHRADGRRTDQASCSRRRTT